MFDQSVEINNRFDETLPVSCCIFEFEKPARVLRFSIITPRQHFYFWCTWTSQFEEDKYHQILRLVLLGKEAGQVREVGMAVAG